VLDGVYLGTETLSVFVEVLLPTDEDVRAVPHKIIGRILTAVTRRGALVEEQDSMYVADDEGDSDNARMMRPLHAPVASPSNRESARCC